MTMACAPYGRLPKNRSMSSQAAANPETSMPANQSIPMTVSEVMLKISGARNLPESYLNFLRNRELA